MDAERLKYLAHLPVILNSSLCLETVIQTAIKQLSESLDAEATTVYLGKESANELLFWKLHGGDSGKLEGKKISSSLGVVGWVFQNKESALINDVAKDKRFFSDIDKETDFATKTLVCAPLLVRGDSLIGVLQVLNKRNDKEFSKEDLLFVEQFSHQLAMAISNAQLYRKAQEKTRQLAVLDRTKNDMITVIAHEFRTPLNIIQNSVELICSGDLTGENKEKISETCLKGLSRLSRTINRVRDAAEITNDVLSVDRQAVSIRELFDELSNEFESVCQGRSLGYSSSIEEGLEAVDADSMLLTVVFKNLISNSIRFTPDNGSVSVRASKQSGLVEFSVSDTGIGFEESESELLFEKFYEGADVMSHSSGIFEFQSAGLGLGLSTVRAFIEAHGASLDVSSVPGEGSTFSFCLPMAE